MKFLKVYKTFRGGRHDGWVVVPEWAKEEADIEYLAKIWAARAPGGDNYGWTVHWEFGTPPIEWLEKELNFAKGLVETRQDYVDFVQKAIDYVRV